jgi:hypothetical protein
MATYRNWALGGIQRQQHIALIAQIYVGFLYVKNLDVF